MPIVKTISQKHLGLNLDVSLMFNDCINAKIDTVLKSVGLLLKLQCFYHIQVC